MGSGMIDGRTWLRECWALPRDADPAASRLLLDRQLRHLFRVVPWYVASNLYTGGGVFFAMWPFLRGQPWGPWAVACLLAHAGWAWHAWSSLQRAGRQGAQGLEGRDRSVSTLWCAACATACGVGIYFAAPLAGSDGTRLLLTAYTPGLIATGVLVGITTPLVSLTWLVVLTAWACLMVGRLGFLLQGMTIALLCCYAFMLALALLFASRLFVKRVEAELAEARQREIVGLLLRDFEAEANDWLWESDRDGGLTRIGARFAGLLGTHEGTLIGRGLAALFSAERLVEAGSDGDVGPEALRRRMEAPVPFSGVVVEAMVDATPRSWSLSAKPLFSDAGEWIGWRGVGNEVSDSRAREAEAFARERHLDHLASHDLLTGLPNRRALMQWLSAEGAGCVAALALLDLDNFKAINDTLGHAAGDTVLRAVARRLAGQCAPGDRVARLGGDEFALLMAAKPARAAETDLRDDLDRMLVAFRTPEWVDGYRVDVRASIGVALPEGALDDAGEWLRRADIALYDAKNHGRDTWRIYRDDMSRQMRERLAMVSDLSVAVRDGELSLRYMALRRVDDLSVQGYEALLRWRHPAHGDLGPTRFMRVAEESGLIEGIGMWVLERACRDALSWQASLSVSVNVSAVQLADPAFSRRVAEVLGRVGLPPHRLELEVTETAIVRNPEIARSTLQRLQRLGVRIAIDDFGVGYSSMAQLRVLPFDRIKLDQAFSAALLDARGDGLTRAIIDSVVRIAAARNVPVTAEGVEDARQLQALREIGCHSVQGFLFGAPVEAPHLVPGLH